MSTPVESDELEELVYYSKKTAEIAGLVQAGGGNSSVKTEDGKMLIKASGIAFAGMSGEKGHSTIDLAKLAPALNSPAKGKSAQQNENAYNLAVSKSLISPVRPSMETGMHVFLPRAVLHTHPAAANVLNCALSGEKILKEIFPAMDFIYVKYVNPGYQLAMEIKEQVSRHEEKKGEKPKIMFLKNHGLVVAANSLEECLKLTIGINKTIESCLNEKLGNDFIEFSTGEFQLKDGIYFSGAPIIKKFVSSLEANKGMLSKFLFPDDAVYFSKGFEAVASGGEISKEKISLIQGKGAFYPWDKAKSAKMHEMLIAKLYILLLLSSGKFGKTSYLKEKNVEFILGMESEKYRQELNRV